MNSRESLLLLLEPGRTASGVLASGKTQSFTATLQGAADYELVLEQPEDDLSIEVTAPGAPVTALFDAFAFSEERFVIHTGPAGAYRIRVRNGTVRSAYQLTLSPRLANPPHGARWLEALQLTTSAKQEARARSRDSLEKAASEALRAAELWSGLGEHLSQIRALLAAGEAYRALTRVAEARDLFLKAHAAASSLKDARAQAESLNDAGVCSWQLGDTQEAFDELQAAVEQWNRAGFEYGRAASLENLGLLAWQTGKLDEAIRIHHLALPVFRGYGAQQATALTLNNLALAYSSAGQYALALARLREALPLFTTGEPESVARAYVNIASIQLLLHDPSAAERSCRKALQLLQNAIDKRVLGEIAVALGRSQLMLRRLGEAASILTEARQDFEQARDRRGLASAAHYLGCALRDAGRTSEALEEFERALKIRREVGIYDMAAESLVEIARIEARRGRLMAASNRMEEALSLTESLRTQVSGEQFRASYMAAKHSYYELQTDLLARLGLDQAAFDTWERSRARSLLDLLGELRGSTPVGIPAPLLQEEQRLQQKLNFDAQQLLRSAAANDTARTANIRNEIEDRTAEFDELEARIRRSSPRYDALNAKPLSLDAVQGLLDENTTLLEFALGTDRSYLWVVTTHTRTLVKLPPRAMIERWTLTAIRILSVRPDRRSPKDCDAVWRAALGALSGALLRPAMPVLRTGRVVIVADGILQYLPFAALPDPSAPHRYFAQRRELILLPSASALNSLRRRRPRHSAAVGTVAVFADPVFGYPDSRVAERAATRVAPRSPITRFQRLAYSRLEAEAIAKVGDPSRMWLAEGFAANKAALLGPRTHNYRILHISTHTSINDEFPLLSGFVFSLIDRRGVPREGVVRLHEIYSMDLSNTDLAVLTACKTGLGREVQGEGLLGFARAFFYAGVRTLAITLWEIDDEATAELNRYFYYKMLGPAKLSAASSLASAQAMVRAHAAWRDPYYWAGVTLAGDWLP